MTKKAFSFSQTQKLLWFLVLLIFVVGLFFILRQPPLPVFPPPSEPVTQENWLEVVARSRISKAGQIFAIPTRYTLLDEEWLFEGEERNYEKASLGRILSRYGTTLENLKKRLGDKMKIEGDLVKITAGRVMHRHPYDYD